MEPRRPDVGQGGFLLDLIRRLSPVKDGRRFSDQYWEDVRSELKIHQGVAEFICVTGLIAGFFIPLTLTGTFQSWDIGIGFGLMVILPLSYQIGVCCFKGFRETYQRWADYSTMMYAIPWKTQIRWMYAPMILVFAVCVVGRILFPHDLDLFSKVYSSIEFF